MSAALGLLVGAAPAWAVPQPPSNPAHEIYTDPQPPSKADFSGHGANTHGPYDSTRSGAPSLNGNGKGQAVGKPCAGCVGKADNKNPKGQLPGGSDPNAGYECDRNHGIGRTNPAHTGCLAGSSSSSTPSPSGSSSTSPSTGGSSSGGSPGPSSGSSGPSSSSSGASGGSSGASSGSSSGSSGLSGASSASPAPSHGTEAAAASRPAPPPANVSNGQLSATGQAIKGITVLGIVLVALGGALLARWRRPAARHR